MYNKIIEAIKAEAAQTKTATAAYIRRDESSLKHESTETRWRQYKRGQITRDQCEQYATERATRRIDRETAAAIERAEEISNAAAIEGITIYINWTRSSGAYNPHAEVKVYTDRGTYTAYGSAYGGNYNKESAAIADALNEIPAALKLIYDQRENDVKIYGTALYNAAPKYERGTGVNQIRTILEAANIILISHDETKTTDHYYFERSENHEKDHKGNN